MKRVLVAGASGYIGRYVANAFKQREWFVRAMARTPEKLKHPGPFGEPALEGVVDEIVTGDATNPDTLHGIADGIDTVFSSMVQGTVYPCLHIHRQTTKDHLHPPLDRQGPSLLNQTLKCPHRRHARLCHCRQRNRQCRASLR